MNPPRFEKKPVDSWIQYDSKEKRRQILAMDEEQRMLQQAGFPAE